MQRRQLKIGMQMHHIGSWIPDSYQSIKFICGHNVGMEYYGQMWSTNYLHFLTPWPFQTQLYTTIKQRCWLWCMLYKCFWHCLLNMFVFYVDHMGISLLDSQARNIRSICLLAFLILGIWLLCSIQARKIILNNLCSFLIIELWWKTRCAS